jgi:hypothetical protein
MYGLRTRIRKRKKLLNGTFHKSAHRKSSDWRFSRGDGQKKDRLRDDAAAGATSAGIDGGRGGRLMLGGGRGEGEERSEGIHCCYVVRGLKDAMELRDAERLSFALSFYTS